MCKSSHFLHSFINLFIYLGTQVLCMIIDDCSFVVVFRRFTRDVEYSVCVYKHPDV